MTSPPMVQPPPDDRKEISTVNAPAPKLLLTVEEAAERLGVGRSTMYGLVLDGAVESIRIGRLRRVPADALVEYLTRLRSGGQNSLVSA
jgi:excisionase family DNA binding protein